MVNTSRARSFIEEGRPDNGVEVLKKSRSKKLLLAVEDRATGAHLKTQKFFGSPKARAPPVFQKRTLFFFAEKTASEAVQMQPKRSIR
jgi:hypothetical protein